MIKERTRGVTGIYKFEIIRTLPPEIAKRRGITEEVTPHEVGNKNEILHHIVAAAKNSRMSYRLLSKLSANDVSYLENQFKAERAKYVELVRREYKSKRDYAVLNYKTDAQTFDKRVKVRLEEKGLTTPTPEEYTQAAGWVSDQLLDEYMGS